MDKTKYKIKLDEIAEVIYNYDFKNEHIGLLGGKSGVALFLAYYSKYKNSQKYLEKALELIESSLSDFNSYNLSYSSGIAGLAWTIEHLFKYDFFDADTNEIFSSIDEKIFEWQNNNLKKGDFDFLHNGLGASMYFLGRNELGHKYLSNVPELLKDNSEIDRKTNEVKWKSKIGLEGDVWGYNFGLSHGIPSIIGILTRLCNHGINEELSKELLVGATNYIKNNSLEPEALSVFPYSIVEGQESSSSRLAWCYGDLGVAISLFQASRILHDDDLKDFSLGVLKKCCSRRDLKDNKLMDAGLCHGTAGIAHIYNHMYKETGDVEFKETAIYWFDQTLKFATSNNAYAGFLTYRNFNNKPTYEKSIGFLEGISGIGLALISLVSDLESAWDESLLIS